uniref:Putative secreted protein n=2 Tax=Anopheles triannulatus TaxID=58253 RepID=A0A2M4AKT4_9DIPT
MQQLQRPRVKVLAVMMALHQVTILLLMALAGATGKPLEIEHPHSFSMFKRGVMLGDVSYSYAATDIGSPANARYKTVTVIKNVSMPKPTSSMLFSDRAEHFYEALEQGLDDHLKKRTHHQVEYWPPRDDNHLQQQKRNEEKKDEQKVPLPKQTQRGTGITGTRNPYYRGRFQQDTLKQTSSTTSTSTSTTTTKPAAIREMPEEEDAKHPIDLLELAKSAARTLNQKANGASGNGNTGPVTFPVDGSKTGKKKANGIVSLAKEYTSIVTAVPQQRQTIVSKLKTKVDPSPSSPAPKITFKQYPATPASAEEVEQPEEIPLVDFEQSEYVFNHKTGQFEFRAASKAPKELLQEYLRASGPGYGYRERLTAAKEGTEGGFSTPTELLFAELQNAVSSRNVTMIKSLAGQLVETINIGKIDFQSLKTHPRGSDDRRSTEQPMMKMMMMETTTAGRSSMVDFGYGAETTTMEYQDDGAATTTEPMAVAMTTLAPTTVATKRPSRYIAPRLRGFKRFSSKKLNQ